MKSLCGIQVRRSMSSVITLDVRVKPGARRESVTVDAGGVVHVAIRQPPVDGKANAALIKLLAKRLGTAKSNVVVVRGATSKIKLVSVPFPAREDALKRLRAASSVAG